MIETKKLYKAYKEWCEENGNNKMSNGKFGREVKRLGIGKKRISTGIKIEGKPERICYYTGIKLKMDCALEINGALQDEDDDQQI
jgi:phage/plasmid-associated DNA primase